MSVIAQAGTKGRQLHKFGGSSLADVKCYLRVAGIMTEYSQPGGHDGCLCGGQHHQPVD